MINFNYSAARELCLALATVCRITLNWKGYYHLNRSAQHLYNRQYAQARSTSRD
jgi:hypothetical protein